MENVDRPMGVNYFLLFSNGIVHGNGRFNKVKRVLLSPHVFWAEAPLSLLTGLCRECGLCSRRAKAPRIIIDGNIALIHMDGLKPWGWPMMACKWNTLTEMRLKVRPSQLSGFWFKENRRSLSWHGGYILWRWEFPRGFFLTQG